MLTFPAKHSKNGSEKEKDAKTLYHIKSDNEILEREDSHKKMNKEKNEKHKRRKSMRAKKHEIKNIMQVWYLTDMKVFEAHKKISYLNALK